MGTRHSCLLDEVCGPSARLRSQCTGMEDKLPPMSGRPYSSYANHLCKTAAQATGQMVLQVQVGSHLPGRWMHPSHAAERAGSEYGGAVAPASASSKAGGIGWQSCQQPGGGILRDTKELQAERVLLEVASSEITTCHAQGD